MKNSNTMIAIIGEDNDAFDMLQKGLEEFPSERVVLIASERFEKKADKVSAKVQQGETKYVRITKIQNTASLEDVFITMKRIAEEEQGNSCIINVETDYMSSCLALSSAFVNGIQAIGVMRDKVIAYPIMKFSYYNTLTDKKMKILETLYENKDWTTVEDLQKSIKMSAPLISYHLNGNLKSKGLKEMGLVETKETKGRLQINLSTLGKLLIRGLVSYECPTCV